MKESPFFQKARENMAPGVVCSQSLIGSDRRSIAEIIDSDAATLRRLKVSTHTIADAMRRFLEAGRRGLDEYIIYADHFEVRNRSVRGSMRCPFGDRGMISKESVRVRNLRLNRSVDFTALNIHLIEEHGFFQGKGAPFRIEPEYIIEVLEISTSA